MQQKNVKTLTMIALVAFLILPLQGAALMKAVFPNSSSMQPLPKDVLPNTSENINDANADNPDQQRTVENQEAQDGPQQFQVQPFSEAEKNRFYNLMRSEEQKSFERLENEKNYNPSANPGNTNEKPW